MEIEIEKIARIAFLNLEDDDISCVVNAQVDYGHHKYNFIFNGPDDRHRSIRPTDEERDEINSALMEIARALECKKVGDIRKLTLTVGQDGKFELDISYPENGYD